MLLCNSNKTVYRVHMCLSITTTVLCCSLYCPQWSLCSLHKVSTSLQLCSISSGRSAVSIGFLPVSKCLPASSVLQFSSGFYQSPVVYSSLYYWPLPVFSGLQQSSLVSTGLQWLLVVFCSGLLAFCGLYWSLVVSTGLRWSTGSLLVSIRVHTGL